MSTTESTHRNIQSKDSKLITSFHEKFSIITVGDNKQPNYPWKPWQSDKQPLNNLLKQYAAKTTQGFGIVTGFEDLECMDVDLKVLDNEAERVDWWSEYIGYLETAIPDFAEKFVIYKTKNGGYHILFKTKLVEKNQKIAKLKGHQQVILETRGVGGYIFAYPENQISKKSYFEIEYISDTDRLTLFSFSRMYNYEEAKRTQAPQATKKAIEGNITPLDDYNAKTDIWEVVGDDFEIVQEQKDKLIIKRHGATSAHSGYIYKAENLMFLHSTGTDYPAEQQITPAAARAYRDFLGNFSDTAAALYAEGFGTRAAEAKPMQPNGKESYSLILEYLSEKGIRLNQLTGVIEINGAPLNDYHISSMLTELSLYSGKNQSKDILLSCIDVIANGNQYQPFLDYVKDLEKVVPTDFLDFDELDKMTDCIISETPKRLIKVYLVRWLLGLFDLHLHNRMTKNVLVLAGEQNACKTSFSKNILATILKQYGKVIDFNPNKMTDGKIALCSLLVACFDEFEEILTKHRTLADFKNLTASYDIFERRPYRRNHEQMFRSSIVMATTNQSNFLNDSTGNTRFLTINVKAFDLEKYFKIDLDKVWRVIYDLHLQGETSVLSEAERALQSQQNQNFEAVDSYVELIEKVFLVDENSFLTSTDIAIELERYTRQNLSINRIGAALKKLGFDRKSKRINGSPKYGYMLKINYNYD
ncbi:VapE domain-containing protein [Flavobacterium sp. WC2416]|uniref:VapE domain-containing protein n=1 Tax=Flavobacterium sp. WC2416 TaxID=3234141 RepID=A0AB39W843_9FLAO